MLTPLKRILHPRSLIARSFSKTASKHIKWTIIDDLGKRHACHGALGHSVLESSIDSGFQFQKACGGNAECLTCHIHIPPEMQSHSAYEPPEEVETDSLMFTVERSENSRLACQMVVNEALQGRQLIFKGE